jgi:hypothetical protein
LDPVHPLSVNFLDNKTLRLEAVLPEDRSGVAFPKHSVLVSEESIDNGQGQRKEDCINMIPILYGFTI